MFDRSKATENKGLTWAQKIFYNIDSGITSDYIQIKRNITYRLNYNAQVILYDLNKYYIGVYNNLNNTVFIFTINNEEVFYIRLGFRPFVNNTLINKIPLKEKISIKKVLFKK